MERLGDPKGTETYNRILAILDSKDKIPHVSKIDGFYYNFWQDEVHVRGIWRRTTLQEYRKAEPQWETIIDVDKIGKDEDVSWVCARVCVRACVHASLLLLVWNQEGTDGVGVNRRGGSFFEEEKGGWGGGGCFMSNCPDSEYCRNVIVYSFRIRLLSHRFADLAIWVRALIPSPPPSFFLLSFPAGMGRVRTP